MNKILVVGGIVVVVAVVVLVFLLKAQDADTTLRMEMVSNVCTITAGNKHDVTVGKNGKVTWHLDNACTTDQQVTIGNFRLAATGANSDCSAPTEGTGVAYPFKAGEENNRSETAPANTSNKKIEQKEAKDPGTSALTYYFDVCLGTKKQDPKLVIEP